MDSNEHDIDATERVPMWFEDEALAEGSSPVLFPHASTVLGRGTPERPTLRYMGSTPASPSVVAAIPAAVAVGLAGAADPARASASFEIEVESPVVEPTTPTTTPARARRRPIRATPAVDVRPMPTFGAAMLKAHKRSGKPVAPGFVLPVFVAPALPPVVPAPAFAPTMLAVTTAKPTEKSTSFGATMLRDFYALLVVMAGSAVLFVAAYFIAGR